MAHPEVTGGAIEYFFRLKLLADNVVHFSRRRSDSVFGKSKSRAALPIAESYLPVTNLSEKSAKPNLGHSMRFHNFAIVVLSVFLATGLAMIAFAHAILVKSLPAPNEIVAGPNVPVALTFNSKIDQARSILTLERPDRGALRLKVDVDPSSPAMLIARISNAGAGSYKLRWQVLAVDGHITRGEVPFQVK